MKAIQRIRGRAGEADEGPHIGKWFYEISIWDLSGEHQAGDAFQFGPFESEAQACAAGRVLVKNLSQHIEKELTGKSSGRFLDLKNGAIMRPWDEQ